MSVPRRDDGEPVDLEIDPRFALDAAELAERLPPGTTVTARRSSRPGHPVMIG